MTIQEARERAERRAGKRLSEEEFEEVLAYTLRKVNRIGETEDYVPLLLMDEIKNHFTFAAINRISKEMQRIFAEDDNRCVICADGLPA